MSTRFNTTLFCKALPLQGRTNNLHELPVCESNRKETGQILYAHKIRTLQVEYFNDKIAAFSDTTEFQSQPHHLRNHERVNNHYLTVMMASTTSPPPSTEGKRATALRTVLTRSIEKAIQTCSSSPPISLD